MNQDEFSEHLREYKRQWYQANRGRVLEKAKARHVEKRDDVLAYQKEWRARDPEKARAKSREWKAANSERHRASSRAYGRANAEAISVRMKAKRRELKQSILDAYGGACACCGEAIYEFLTLDHVNGDGAEHRRALKAVSGRSHKVYQDLIDRGFPPGFRVLCFNCNSALGFYGYCPHQSPATSARTSASESSS